MTRDTIARFAFAAAAVAVAVLVRLALTPALGDRAQYVILALPPAIVTWYAGFWPGIAAAVLGLLAAVTVLAPRAGGLALPGVPDIGAALLSLGVGLGIVAVTETARRRGDELARRNEELARLLAQNQALLALRDGFSGMLGHEVRSPLTVILGGLRILSRRSRTWGDPDAEEVVADVEHEAERLHRMVEDLLVVSRGDASLTVEREPVLVQRVVPRAITAIQRRHPRLCVEADLPAALPAVAADPTLLEQVVVNLLSNAAKYAGEEATVRLEARAREEVVRVRVADDGPGFPPDSLRRAFEAFYRAPGSQDRAPGAGIGLYVVRRISEAMGGSVTASNGVQGGAVVTLELPMALVDPDGEPAPGTATPPDGRPLRSTTEVE